MEKSPKIIVFLLGFLLYLPTVNLDFALDDKIVMTNNTITQKGLSGIADQFKYDSMHGFWASVYGIAPENLNKDQLVAGGRYRPITLITHNIEWALFPNSPWIGHLINALLYGLLCMVLFMWLNQLFPNNSNKWWSTASIAVIIFTFHPLHIEAVANIKGRDEILSMLLAVYAVYMWGKNNFQNNWLAAFVMLLAFLSKESALAFVGVVPLINYFFNDKPLKEAIISAWPFYAMFGIYLLIRIPLIGFGGTESNELMNNPFLEASHIEKFAAILLTFTAYLKLFILPYPLTHDYYPFHLPFTDAETHYPAMTHWAVLMGIVLVLLSVYFVFQGFKEKKTYAFAILFVWGTFLSMSNIILPVGVFMNERFMFMPSLGLAILVAAWLAKKETTVLKIGTVLVLIAWVGIDVMRSQDWKNDQTLSIADAKVSVGSAKVHMGAGSAYLQLAESTNNIDDQNYYLNEAYTHLTQSLNIYPGYFPPLDLLGGVYYKSQDYVNADKYYGYCLTRKPENSRFYDMRINCGTKLMELGKVIEAKEIFESCIEANPNRVEGYVQLAEIHGRFLNTPGESKKYLRQALAISPNNSDILQKLGIVHAMMGEFGLAIESFGAAMDLDPNSPTLYRNLSLTYRQMGDMDNAVKYEEKANSLQ